jgi:transposase
VKRLMTIPGIDMVVALALIAAIGDVERFAKPGQLAGYLGLNPSVRQSGPGPAYHGRITKQGRGHARGMLVGAGWAAARFPRPAAELFSSGAEPARPTHRCCRDGTQARHPDLASADKERKNYLWAPIGVGHSIRPISRASARVSRAV